MKTLFVHPAIRTYRQPLFHRLGNEGVHFLFSTINPSQSHAGEETSRILATFPYPYCQAREFQKLPVRNFSWDLVRTFKYDVILFSGLTSIPFLLCAGLLKLLGKRVILFDETWRFPYEVRRYRPFLGYIRFLVRRCVDAFVVAGSSAKRMFMQDFKIPEEKICIAYNTTVDLMQQERLPDRAEAIRQSVLAVGRGRKVILYLGRLIELKGLDVLIRTLANLGEDTCLVVVGSGPFQSRCQELVAELELEERVHFLGACPSDESLYYYLCADIFVLPGRFLLHDFVNCEAWGFTANEAMSLEIPTVLTTAVGASADLICDGESGMLAQENDPQSMQEKLEYLLCDEPRRRRIGRQGRARLTEICSYDQNFCAFQAAIQRARGAC
jgi:glycosyltransferase involved in cell wall biosynthesis